MGDRTFSLDYQIRLFYPGREEDVEFKYVDIDIDQRDQTPRFFASPGSRNHPNGIGIQLPINHWNNQRGTVLQHPVWTEKELLDGEGTRNGDFFPGKRYIGR